jgi:N-acetylglucosaminyl-diphospho-decaprenol L-rhamnosyltransferase
VATPPSVDVIIVNWNANAVVGDCVQSVFDADAAGLEIDRVVVIDNASTVRLPDFPQPWASRVTIIRNSTNLGFAAACNQGAHGSEADYLLFLNPDMTLGPGALTATATFMQAADHQDVGICGIRMVDAAGVTVPSSRRFPTLGGVLGESTGLSRVWPSVFPPLVLPPPGGIDPIDVDQVIGAFFFIRRSLFEKLEGFDEQFFVYYEEVDASYRARQRGYRSVYLPAASAFHHGGYSTSQARLFRLFHSLRSRARYARKHWSPFDRFLLGLATCTIEFPLRLVKRGRT